MNVAGTGFDRLAFAYRALEFAAFGRDLERARFAFLNRLSGCREILLVGEGDGRCAERLALLVPQAHIHCVDSSAGMIARALRRPGLEAASGRVTFQCADVRSFSPEPGRFDAVATLFFLDCFDAAGVASIVARLEASLRPGALWLFADFVLPAKGAARLRARIWIGILYAFFRVAAGLRVSSLPPSEDLLSRAGWTRRESEDFQWGLIRSAVYARMK
jgi:hypothetical protein